MAMSLLHYFDRIYVINLAYRTDRRAEMETQLRRIGLSFSTPGVQRFEAVRPADAGGFPTVGTHGCFLSHLGVLRDAARAGHRRILLFEDDLDFSSDFAERVPAVLDALAHTPWSLFYGGYRIDDGAALPAAAGPLRAVPGSLSFSCAHFVGFERDTITSLVEDLEGLLRRRPGDPEGGPMHVDGAYARYRSRHPECRTLVAVPELGHQRPSRTDIHALRWYDLWPGVRAAAQRLRRLRHRP